MNRILNSRNPILLDISINRAGICRSVNESGLQFLEKNVNEVIGEKIEKVLDFCDSNDLLSNIEIVFDDGKDSGFEIKKNLNGTDSFFRIIIKPLSSIANKVQLAQICISDEIDLDVVIKEASQAELLRNVSDALGAVAHEVNNPLSVVLGYSEILLLEAPRNSDTAKKIETIKSHAERIKNLIIRMGDLTQFETKPYILGSEILDINKSSAPDAIRKKSVLIVDDQEDICMLYCMLLQKEGYTVDFVNSGFSALDLILKNYYAIILLDIMMPGLDGIQTLNEIKNIYTKKGLAMPVTVLVSSFDTDDLKEKTKGLSVFKALQKPIPNQVLIDTVKEAEEYANNK